MNESIQSLLYTIASLSASFVAILGGFVASKLLSISSERESIKNQLSKITGDMVLKKAHKNMLFDQLNTEDALGFIDEHIIDLVNKLDLSDTYKETERELLSYDLMLPYWNKGLELVTRIEALDKESLTLNDDYVPNAIAADVKKDYFSYKVCEMIFKTLHYPHAHFVKEISEESDNWYEHTSQKFEDIEHEIYALAMQKAVLEGQKEALSKPSGMVRGLVIFILFSLFNIIFPLILSTINFSGECAKRVSYISIGILAIGLAAVFKYLIDLLKWKPDEDDSKNTDTSEKVTAETPSEEEILQKEG